MNEARRRRAAKQDRRDARRALKRRRIAIDENVMITTIRSALAGHPLELLHSVSSFMSTLPGEELSLANAITALVEWQCRETTALLAVAGEMLVDDEALRERCRLEVAKRHHHLPKWIVGLRDVQVNRAVRRADAVGDGDELFVGLVMADSTELTLGVILDHNVLSSVTDFAILAEPFEEAVARQLETYDPTVPFGSMNLADARTWIDEGLRWSALLQRSRSAEWREVLPIVKWVLAQLPGGGCGSQRPAWEEDVADDLLDGFLSSPAGAPFADVDYRVLLRELWDTGCGDPLRWSASRLWVILRTRFNDYDLPLEIALDAPALLRAYVPFAHGQSGIAQHLTDEAIATIDRLSLGYRRELLANVIDHDDDPWMISYPDRAS
ncbi:hypothetical protein [Mycobacterium sp. AT1]|uniref:hypothetical protein n=1 Tax=Mycobacterium sp. AT1 TaxID=1961706 RepID=UPI0009C66394|nr:hypothetical protein [Mycobacterium sp. AT1]OPX07995.1 hypothetical protein B1790_21150 [Mycobacterium sp. AT1]